MGLRPFSTCHTQPVHWVTYCSLWVFFSLRNGSSCVKFLLWIFFLIASCHGFLFSALIEYSKMFAFLFSLLPVLLYKVECLCVCEWMNLFVTGKLCNCSLIINPYDTYSESAWSGLPKSFALSVCLAVILWRKFRIHNRKSVYYDHATKAYKEGKLKLKISNAIC